MTNLLSGRKTVAATGTAERIGASQSIEAVAVQALAANTNPVVVGGSDVVAAASTRKGIYLNAGDVCSIEADDLGDIWIDAVTNGEGVTFLASTEA
jgi:hypothetical protein